MQPRLDADDIRAEYRYLRSIPARARTVDETRSGQILDADDALHTGTAVPDGTPHSAIRWVTRLHEVEEFVAQHGRLPRFNRRRKAEMDATETQLEGWLRTQKASHDALSSYQRARLEALPGFVWRSRDAQWDETIARYDAFLARARRVPRERSHDPHEAALASWAEKQRRLRRHGKLSIERARRLESLPIWGW